MEPITYYTRGDEEFGVLALTLPQLRIVRDALGYALDRAVPALDPKAYDIQDEVAQGIARMAGREASAGGL